MNTDRHEWGVFSRISLSICVSVRASAVLHLGTRRGRGRSEFVLCLWHGLILFPVVVR